MLLLLKLETTTQRLTVATPRDYLSVCLLHTFPPPTDSFPQHPSLLMGCQCLYTMMVLLSLLLLLPYTFLHFSLSVSLSFFFPLCSSRHRFPALSCSKLHHLLSLISPPGDYREQLHPHTVPCITPSDPGPELCPHLGISPSADVPQSSIAILFLQSLYPLVPPHLSSSVSAHITQFEMLFYSLL